MIVVEVSTKTTCVALIGAWHAHFQVWTGAPQHLQGEQWQWKSVTKTSFFFGEVKEKQILPSVRCWCWVTQFGFVALYKCKAPWGTAKSQHHRLPENTKMDDWKCTKDKLCRSEWAFLSHQPLQPSPGGAGRQCLLKTPSPLWSRTHLYVHDRH